MTVTIKDGKVFAKVPKAEDLETHVRFRKLDGHRFADIRDYVPSTKTYGRGILVPYDEERGDSLALLIQGLADLNQALK